MKTPKMMRLPKHAPAKPHLRARHMSAAGRSAFPPGTQAFPPGMPVGPDQSVGQGMGPALPGAAAPGDMGQ